VTRISSKLAVSLFRTRSKSKVVALRPNPEDVTGQGCPFMLVGTAKMGRDPSQSWSELATTAGTRIECGDLIRKAAGIGLHDVVEHFRPLV
jgi:hypothetical protein